MLGQIVGIDIGTSNLLACVRGKGVVFCEPTLVVQDKKSKKIIGYGEDAYQYLGRTACDYEVIYPMKDGAVANYVATEKILKYCLDSVATKSIFKPIVVASVAEGVTELEKRALKNALISAGARTVELVASPILSAMGAGVDTSKPNGNLIIDIGGGITSIAVLSYNGVVFSSSIKAGGNTFDSAILKYIRKKYGVVIGEKTATNLRSTIGKVIQATSDETARVKGMNIKTGLPIEINISASELNKAMELVAQSITEEIRYVLNSITPALLADIVTNGIYVTGGGAYVQGIAKYIEYKTKIPVNEVKSPELCTITGIEKYIKNMEK